MIHYHGAPVTPESVARELFPRRHVMVSYAHPGQIELAAEFAHTFAADNGTFPAYMAGRDPDFDGYADWIDKWRKHPAFDWCLIPDVIEGTEQQNDELIKTWPDAWCDTSVPVWHLHESLIRLADLVERWPRVALGSSGDFSDVASDRWWHRMAEAMEVACDGDGYAKTKLHGLRMLAPYVFSRLPLSSADSTNVARNHGIDSAWDGPYTRDMPQTTRACGLADRIERHASARRWVASGIQQSFNPELFG